jgi:hypothetical protein
MNSNSKARPMNVIKTKTKLLILQIIKFLLGLGDQIFVAELRICFLQLT